MKPKHVDFVVCGAGVAGLAFAWKMSKAGKKVLILEKDTHIGGLSRTIHHKGFFVDYCGHRFHSANPDILRTVLSLKYLTMHRHIKKTRIVMFDKYLKYPFELPNLLRAMPFRMALVSGIDFIMNVIKKKITPSNALITYKEWFVNIYGEKLYQVMCEPYTTKIWKMSPDHISSDWAEQRFGGPNLVQLVKKSLRKLLTFDFSSYSLEDDALAPDGGIFYYPEKGIGQMPDAFAKEAKDHGCKILTGVTISSIQKKKRKIVFEQKGQKHTVSYDALVSTIPPISLYQLQEKKSKQIESIFQKNRYMDMIFVYVFINKTRISNDHWIYFPDPTVLFNRSVEFSNWSPVMTPKGKTCVCLDISCYRGDAIWNMTDKAIVSRCIDDASRVQYFQPNQIYGSMVKRIQFAYPVYDIGYKERLQQIVSFLETDSTYLLGRTGIFRYNNSDNSIEMALQLADNFIAQRKDKSVFEYKIKKHSL